MSTDLSKSGVYSGRLWKWLARCWLAVGLVVSVVLLVRAMPHSPWRATRSSVGQPTVHTNAHISPQQLTTTQDWPRSRTETVYVRRLVTRPIETIQVGQRVLGTNPDREEVEEFEEPDPKTWRTIEVELIKPDGKRLYATLLRPLQWIEEELDPETNTIELDLPELGVEGLAQVLRIGPCPPIAPGPGQVVTGTFKHEADGDLVTVVIQPSVVHADWVKPQHQANEYPRFATATDYEIHRGTNESRILPSSGDYEIGCTANHPFWSEDRQEFVEAGQLREGERVRTRLDEIAHVVQVKPRPPTKWVYNLEVQGEHVYEVGPGGVLVHNNCSQHARILRKNLIEKFGEEAAKKYAAHIVPSGKWAKRKVGDKVREMQEWLTKAGIDIDDAANGFFTDCRRHLGTHRDDFIDTLYKELKKVVKKGGDQKQMHANMVNKLNKIRERILSGEFLGSKK